MVKYSDFNKALYGMYCALLELHLFLMKMRGAHSKEIFLMPK